MIYALETMCASWEVYEIMRSCSSGVVMRTVLKPVSRKNAFAASSVSMSTSGMGVRIMLARSNSVPVA